MLAAYYWIWHLFYAPHCIYHHPGSTSFSNMHPSLPHITQSNKIKQSSSDFVLLCQLLLAIGVYYPFSQPVNLSLFREHWKPQEILPSRCFFHIFWSEWVKQMRSCTILEFMLLENCYIRMKKHCWNHVLSGLLTSVYLNSIPLYS